MIRVLIVEDSITQREILRRLLANDPELTVVAEARNGKEAIVQVQAHSPDVVLMDIHMPDMDGIMATAEIMRLCPVPIVVASATLKKRDVDLAMRAYEAGAVSVIEKPEGAVLLHLQKIGPELRRELIAAAKVQLAPRAIVNRSALAPTSTAPNAAQRPEQQKAIVANVSISVIGICISTGGPPILAKMFSQIPKPFPIPILLVQHISRGFEEGFAQWLSVTTGQSVKIAVDRQQLFPGVWIAPTGRHLTVAGVARMELPQGKQSEIHCPSGNPLFETMATYFGPKAIGILMTGMGDDGADGLLKLKQAGGTTIIQDEASCPIWGMPKAAQKKGAAMHVFSPEQIVSVLSGLTGNERHDKLKING